MKRMKKSVLATSVAAAALVAGAVSPVKAEDLATKTPDKNKEEVQSQDVTLEQVESSANQVAEAQAKVDEQKAVVAADEAAQAAAQEEEKAAETAVSQAKDLVAEATPEVIEAAETDFATAEVALPEAEKAVATVVEEKAQVDSQVAAQEEKVAQAENAVTEAQTELAKAARSAAPEAKELTQAQAAEKSAAEQVTLRQNELKGAERAVQAQAASQASQEQKIKQLESAVHHTQSEIAAKEAEIAQAKKSSSHQAVLKDAAYTGFLATLGNQAAFQKALTTSNQNGLSASQNGSPATMENALRAVEVMKEINRHRREAGLQELLVDPYKNVESQIQAVGFHAKGWHTSQFFSWENVAWRLNDSSKDAVDFWYNEKALYQTYARQLGLPTAENQLNTWELYQKLGSERFSQVGHYVTMMGKEFNTMTAASTQLAGRYYSEAGFHTANLNSGLYMTVADYEKALRNYITNSNTEVNLSGLNSQLATLKNKKKQQSTELTNLKSNLSNGATSLTEKNKAVNTAQANLAVAKTQLATAQRNVSKAQSRYNQALAQIEEKLKPQRANLEVAKENLKSEQAKLQKLTASQTAAEQKVDQVQAKLAAAKEEVQAKKKRTESLKNAKELLAQAQEALSKVRADVVEKGQATVHSKEELNLLLTNLIALQENHLELLKRYRALHPEADVTAIIATAGEPAIAIPEYFDLASLQDTKPDSIPTTLRNEGVLGSEVTPTVFATTKADSVAYQAEKTSSSATKVLGSAHMLPNTASTGSHLAVAGLAVGTVALAAASLGRKKEEK